MNKKATSTIGKVFFLISLVAFTFNLGFYFGSFGFTLEPFSDLLGINGGTTSGNFSMCINMSVEDSSICLRNYVKTFYNYTERSDKKRTLEDIKANGGDCYDYSRLYEEMAREIGFSSKHIKISNGSIAHGFSVIWGEKLDQYCVVDQKSVSCMNLDLSIEKQKEVREDE